MECMPVVGKFGPKTLSAFTFALILCWTVFGSILIGAFSDMEISEPRSDFQCDGKGDIDKDFLRGKCYDQYRRQNHQLGIPPYMFIIVNVAMVPTVTLIYSICVWSTVNACEHGAQEEPRNQRLTLFIAYLCQLIVHIVLEITFIVLLETHLVYPRNFPSDFSCSIENPSFNRMQSTNLFACFNHRAGSKNAWTTAVKVVNGIFASCAFLEILWILWRARNGRIFMQNQQFYDNHLKSNSGKYRPVPAPDPNDLHSAIKTLKANCLKGIEKLGDLKQPFGRPSHGEGPRHDLKMDEIYVNVAIHQGRARHNFAKGRSKQLPDADDRRLFEKPEDIFDEAHKNVLAVGHPGIGKTWLSIKMLRLWATGEAFNEDDHENSHFDVVFLVKFKRFNNDNAKLSLCDLLAQAETVHNLDDAVWDSIKKESTKVLLIFDGLDEYSRKEDINAQEDDRTYKNCVEEKMPLSVLYKKLVAEKLLPSASILTTTRPTAVKYVDHLDFQRTVEIGGFSPNAVKEYVEKFAQGNPEAKKLWELIKSNINLFSFCYIPMNCFLICHGLLQIIRPESRQPLPTRMTDIYKMTVKMIFFNHNSELQGSSQKELEKLKSTHMYKPFEKFPAELQKIFNSLGEIAYKGVKEGRLLFESSEVSRLEDCGLLHKLPDLKPKALGDPPKSQFCFPHPTVQEFFAAKHLVDTKTREGIEEFVCNHINDATWQVVLQFVAGLLKSTLSSDIFIKLLPKSTEERRICRPQKEETLTYWPATRDKDLAVQVCKCLYEINDEQEPVLQNKIEKIEFNTVEFRNCYLAPIDAAAVLHFLENAEEVVEINLSCNALGDLGANEVKRFIVNRKRKLKRLYLSFNYLTDNAAKDFAAALQHSNCKLESLDLSDNNLTDNAAKDFAAALEHSKLKSLYLRSNQFTDNAAKDFAAALKHSNCKLKSLVLSGHDFTDNAAKDFAGALKHSDCKLELLALSDKNLTENAVKEFHAALKHGNCKLESSSKRFNNSTAERR